MTKNELENELLDIIEQGINGEFTQSDLQAVIGAFIKNNCKEVSE